MSKFFKSDVIKFADGARGMVLGGVPKLVPGRSDGLRFQVEVDDEGKSHAWVQTVKGEAADPVLFVSGFENFEAIVSGLVHAASGKESLLNAGILEIGNGDLCAYYSSARLDADENLDEGPETARSIQIEKGRDEIVTITAYVGKPQDSRSRAGNTIVAISAPMDRSVADAIVEWFDDMRTQVRLEVERIERENAQSAPSLAPSL